MSPEDPKTRAAQERILGSMTPADFYSKSPYPSKAPSPHVPSPLRYAASPGVPIALHHVLTPGTPTATRGSSASFAIVIGPSPNGYARPTLGNPSITTKKRGRPFRSPQAASVQPIAKKKGRPFKTPEAAAAAAARASRGNSTDQILKKRRRPFKYPQAPEEIDPVDPAEPRFVPFICEWNDCPAELHNLDTLAAHLITVHLKKQSSAGPLICLWRNCCQKNKAMNNDGSLKVFDKGVEFKTKEEWRNHVKLHLDHVARWQGDGPQTELSFTKKQQPALSYSFHYGGPEGQATPSIRNQQIEEGRAKDNNLSRFRKKRDGLYVVYEPVENPEFYMKAEDDNYKGNEADIDEH